MRLIDADELKTWFGEKDLYSYDYIIDTINDAPTIEPERKKGKWNQIISIPNDMYGRYYCSECGKEGNLFWYFCPNCGAEMRGGRDED